MAALPAERAVGDDADVDARQLADELRDERAAQDLGPARLVGRADEDVGRAALARDLLDERRRGRRPRARGSACRGCSRAGAAPRARRPPPRDSSSPGRRTHSASTSEPSRAPERNARRSTRCERGSGVTSTRIRSATACWLSGSSTVSVPSRLDVLGQLAQHQLAQRREVVEAEEVLQRRLDPVGRGRPSRRAAAAAAPRA